MHQFHQSRAFLIPPKRPPMRNVLPNGHPMHDVPPKATAIIMLPCANPPTSPTPHHHAQRLAPSQYKALGSGLARNATIKKLSFAGSHMGDRALQVRHLGGMAFEVRHLETGPCGVAGETHGSCR